VKNRLRYGCLALALCGSVLVALSAAAQEQTSAKAPVGQVGMAEESTENVPLQAPAFLVPPATAGLPSVLIPCNGRTEITLGVQNGVASKLFFAINVGNGGGGCAVTFDCDGANRTGPFTLGTGPVVFACPAGRTSIQVRGAAGGGATRLQIYGAG